MATSVCGRSATKHTGPRLRRVYVYAETFDAIFPVAMTVPALHRKFVNGNYATAGNAGSRSSRHRPVSELNIELAAAEGHVPSDM